MVDEEERLDGVTPLQKEMITSSLNKLFMKTLV